MRLIPAPALLAAMLMLMLGACGGDDPPAAPAQAPALAAAPASAPARAAPATAPAPIPAPRAAPAPPGMSAPTDLAQLRQEVASLRREVAEMRMILTRAPPAAQPPASVLATPLAAETPALAPAETMFRAEPVDHAWSSQASSAVRAALARANGELESQVRQLECRTKTCRVEVNPAIADQLESAMPAVLANLGATLPNMTATQVGSDDGSAATVLYLTR